MAKTTTGVGNVIDLGAHPKRQSARQRSLELAEAMRRHPSYQGLSLVDARDQDIDESRLLERSGLSATAPSLRLVRAVNVGRGPQPIPSPLAACETAGMQR